MSCRIFHIKIISVTEIIIKERLKLYMDQPKVPLQVLQERVFMDISKDVCTYYTLRGREDRYGNKILEKKLRKPM